MRFLVKLRYATASFDEQDEAKARELYEAEGLSLSICKDLFDEGTVIEGIATSEWGAA